LIFAWKPYLPLKVQRIQYVGFYMISHGKLNLSYIIFIHFTKKVLTRQSSKRQSPILIFSRCCWSIIVKNTLSTLVFTIRRSNTLHTIMNYMNPYLVWVSLTKWLMRFSRPLKLGYFSCHQYSCHDALSIYCLKIIGV
jgi:hypothetical protein